ncbi:MAG: VOC family protein [Acidobacteriota bacterium]
MKRLTGFWGCVAGLVLAASPATGESSVAAAGSAAGEGSVPGVAELVDGFKETAFAVQNLEGAITLYTEVAGWEVMHRGRADASVARFWRLPEDQVIEEALLRNPGTTEGYLRLVRFPGSPPKLIRPGAQSWDTGGIFDVNVRVLDIHARLADLRRHGWRAYSEPVEFSFGPFVVREVLALGPDGLVLAMIERVQPPLEGWPNLRRMSRIFNATQVVRDFETSFAFYTETLGFKPYLEHEGASKAAGPNVLGLPHNLTTEIPRKVAILSPQGDNFGSIEILSFDGATGDDFAERAVPPHLGHLLMRFPVTDLDAYLALLKSRGVEPVSGPSTVDIAPYGQVPAFAIQAPEGAWLEFIQLPVD